MERVLPNSEVLLTRALNATRNSYFPTYVGLRLIGTQLSSGDSGLLERLIVRRLNASEPWRFKKFPLYKGSVAQQGEVTHEYRNALTGSPFTAITEAFILAMFARDPAFATPARAFSYRWPRSAYAGSSYQFYYEGYLDRNDQIGRAMQGNRVAVVCDIQSFYPSVPSDFLKEALTARLQRCRRDLQASGDEILQFFSSQIVAGGNGIPIGPSSAHVLGHLALEGVDSELTERFDTAYYRYVDDIVVVCARDDAQDVQRLIRSVLKSHGLDVNPSKTAILTRDEWHQEVVRPDVGSDDTFRHLIRDLIVYLVFHPDRAQSLRTTFSKHGLPVPVKRLLALSSYSRFRYFLRRGFGALGRSTYAFFATNHDFLSRALDLKKQYEGALDHELRGPTPTGGHTRRWKIQRIRRLVNVLFYLRRFDEWAKGVDQLEAVPELVEQRALANALRTGSVASVLPFFGRGPAAFAELWGETETTPAAFTWPATGLLGAELESLIMLQLYGVVQSIESQAP